MHFRMPALAGVGAGCEVGFKGLLRGWAGSGQAQGCSGAFQLWVPTQRAFLGIGRAAGPVELPLRGPWCEGQPLQRA